MSENEITKQYCQCVTPVRNVRPFHWQCAACHLPIVQAVTTFTIPAAGAPAQQGVTLEELKALAEDGLLVTFDKDHRFSFSRVVNLMAEFAEHIILGRGTRDKNTSLNDQLAIIDAIANAIERDK